VLPKPDERLKPSLLDRLTDDAPNESREAMRHRFANPRSLRESVIRDLGWLLNSVRLSSVQDLAAYPRVARSVVNFGLPDLAGRTLTSIDVPELEQQLRQAIIDYEPRLMPDTVSVTVRAAPTDMGVNSMHFVIEAMLQAYPVPLALCLRTEIDFETGDVSVAEIEGGHRGSSGE
jgi:type VI secretion system protein ImpF